MDAPQLGSGILRNGIAMDAPQRGGRHNGGHRIKEFLLYLLTMSRWCRAKLSAFCKVEHFNLRVKYR